LQIFHQADRSIIIENWKPIAGYRGFYDVSDCGNVRSWHTQGMQGVKRSEPRTLRPGRNKKGYLFVILSFEGEKKNIKVHKLVAETFIRKREQGETIDHIDGIKSNNRLVNLEYCSNRENTSKHHRARESSSEFIGVSFNKKAGRFYAQIYYNGKSHHLIMSPDENLCASVYNNALEAIKLGTFDEFIISLKKNANPAKG
jgi:hypothetical protein